MLSSISRARVAMRIACAVGLVALPAAAGAAGARSVLLAKPRADAVLEPLAAGYTLWLARRIEATGLATESEPPGAGADLASVLSHAAQLDVAYAVIPDLGLQNGQAQVRLRLYAPGSEELLAITRAEAPLASLGDACEETAQRLLAHLGVPPTRAASGPPPLLDELASSSRALGWVDRGELARAWREVEGKLSPTAARSPARPARWNPTGSCCWQRPRCSWPAGTRAAHARTWSRSSSARRTTPRPSSGWAAPWCCRTIAPRPARPCPVPPGWSPGTRRPCC
jgi:hypothetical protein